MMMPSIFGENLFDDFMNDDLFDMNWMMSKKSPFYDIDKTLYGKHAARIMKTDVKDSGDSYEVDIDLPGFKKDDIQAELENGYLTIKAEKKLDKEEGKKDDKKEKNYIRKERYSGSMSRSFYVGDEVTQDEIQSKYEDGILRLNIPKKEKAAVEQKKYVAIEG